MYQMHRSSSSNGIKLSTQPSIRSLDWVLRFIDEVYNSRYQCFLNEIASLDGSVETFSSFVFNFVSKKFGLDSLVKQAAFELLESVKHYRLSNKQVELFGLFLTPYYSAIDLMFFLHARYYALHECVAVSRLPFENKRRQRKVGSVPQYIPGQRVNYLTKKVLMDQPRALIENCAKEINDTLKRRTQTEMKQKHISSPQNSVVFKDGKVEFYEYLIILLIHYKAFRDAKNSKGKAYFYTLMPEEVPPHLRRRDPQIQQYIQLRETKFHRNLLANTLRKKEMMEKQEARRLFNESLEMLNQQPNAEDHSQDNRLYRHNLYDTSPSSSQYQNSDDHASYDNEHNHNRQNDESGTTGHHHRSDSESEYDSDEGYEEAMKAYTRVNDKHEENDSVSSSGEQSPKSPPTSVIREDNEAFIPPLHSSSPRERYLSPSHNKRRPEETFFDDDPHREENYEETQYHSDYFSDEEEMGNQYVVSADQEQRNDVYEEEEDLLDNENDNDDDNGLDQEVQALNIEIPKLDLNWLHRHPDDDSEN